MARNFEFIKDITDRKDIWKVAVKVKDKWSAMKDGKEYFEMVVCDAKLSVVVGGDGLRKKRERQRCKWSSQE
ncbi:hypothetical protein P8452_44177 [Trifolium repens]|nr:hypothetical protein P8452_44177 [Trifolium repens]